MPFYEAFPDGREIGVCDVGLARRSRRSAIVPPVRHQPDDRLQMAGSRRNRRNALSHFRGTRVLFTDSNLLVFCKHVSGICEGTLSNGSASLFVTPTPARLSVRTKDANQIGSVAANQAI